MPTTSPISSPGSAAPTEVLARRLNAGPALPIEGDVRRALAALVAVALVALAPVAHAAPKRPRVLLFGDSLLVEAAPHVRSLAAKAGIDVDIEAYGGTAICDWTPGADATRRRFTPDVSVVAFSGNSLTPCTQRRAGSSLGIAYGKDLDAMVRVLKPSGPVYAVRPPARRYWNISAQAVDASYADAGRAGSVRLIEGGQLISPGGTWVQAMPCLAGEPCAGPVVQKVRENVVRSPDGLHFCPTGYDKGRCGQWSSGAYRYALTIMGVVVRDLGR
jgi:hypothetical protein